MQRNEIIWNSITEDSLQKDQQTKQRIIDATLNKRQYAQFYKKSRLREDWKVVSSWWLIIIYRNTTSISSREKDWVIGGLRLSLLSNQRILIQFIPRKPGSKEPGPLSILLIEVLLSYLQSMLRNLSPFHQSRKIVP